MTPKDQVLMLATHVDYYKQACERLTAELKAAQAPDCRTCKRLYPESGRYGGYEYKCDKPCTNGDQYTSAPSVVLWRTE